MAGDITDVEVRRDLLFILSLGSNTIDTGTYRAVIRMTERLLPSACDNKKSAGWFCYQSSSLIVYQGYKGMWERN